MQGVSTNLVERTQVLKAVPGLAKLDFEFAGFAPSALFGAAPYVAWRHRAVW